jgi:hypothetical protein
MLTVLEQRYLERMPNILADLVEEVRNLREEVAELRKELDKKED